MHPLCIYGVHRNGRGLYRIVVVHISGGLAFSGRANRSGVHRQFKHKRMAYSIHNTTLSTTTALALIQIRVLLCRPEHDIFVVSICVG